MKTSFFDIENWKEIGSTLARNKTRTFLTAFGIFWGVFMLACLMGGARGAEDLLRKNFDGFATNSGILFPGSTTMPYKGHAKGRYWQTDITDIKRMRELFPQLETVTSQSVERNISFRNGSHAYSGQVWGVEQSFKDVMLPYIESGRFINEADSRFQRKVAVIGKKVANELYPREASPVGKMLLINDITYTIIGVASQTNEIEMNDRIDNVVIIPLSTFQKGFNRGEKVDVIMMVGNQTANLAELQSDIRRIIYSRHQIAPTDKSAMWFMDISERFAKLDTLFMSISFLALFIGLSTLIAGIIGIGNIMWVIVKERTQEFGIRRAIGAKPIDVTIQILSEGVALTAVAGLTGITMACIALAAATNLTSDGTFVPRFQMTLWQALALIGLFVVLGTLAGVIPAIKAMRIKPIEAINDK